MEDTYAGEIVKHELPEVLFTSQQLGSDRYSRACGLNKIKIAIQMNAETALAIVYDPGFSS